MPSFAIRYPFFILMLCLAIIVVGVTTVARMPVDLFPPIDIPVVVVATFYGGMPPQQVEANITDTFERFFTLGSNIDHIESRSLTGVSLIRVYFQPGTDPDAAASEIANLAMADLRRLPQGTLPPVVLKMDASSLPVCLVTLKGQGLNETDLHDEGQFTVRNQIANVPGASVPQPYGGKYRQIQFYVDPVKLEAAQMSPMDVVNVINNSNKILPAGDVRIGPKDYNIYSNSQLPNVSQMNDVPLKAIGNGVLRLGISATPRTPLPFNTTSSASTARSRCTCPSLSRAATATPSRSWTECANGLSTCWIYRASGGTNVVFDQSQYVKTAVSNVLREGGIGLVLTAVMILIFLGSMRGTLSVLISIPVSCLAAFLLLERFRRDHQYHGPGWTGLGAVATDRQLRGRVGEHLPPHGRGRGCGHGSRAGRSGGAAGGAGGHLHHRDRFLPCCLSLRRQQVPVYRAGAGGCAGLGCLIPGGHDRGALVLRQVHQDRRTAMAGTTSTKSVFGRFVAGFNHHYNRMLVQV